MDIALMNEKVIFQKCSVVKDGIGNHRNEWTEDYCCFATIGGEGLASSREAEAAGTVVEDVGMTVTVRYCKKTAGIRSVTHRILFRDQVYDIVSVDLLSCNMKSLKFTCRKVRRRDNCRGQMYSQPDGRCDHGRTGRVCTACCG